MKKYTVEFFDPANGATSAIDTIVAADNYTAEHYVADCEANADEDWIEMLHRGTVTLAEAEN